MTNMLLRLQGLIDGDDITQYANAITIALAIYVIILTTCYILITKYTREKTYNKLTLRPYFSILAFLTLLCVQTILLEFWPHLDTDEPYVLFLRLIQSVKALFVYLSVSMQLLEWYCLW